MVRLDEGEVYCPEIGRMCDALYCIECPYRDQESIGFNIWITGEILST